MQDDAADMRYHYSQLEAPDIASGRSKFPADTERLKAAERRLRLFEKVFESALEAIMISLPDGTIVLVNPAFTTITGYTPDEVIGRKPMFLKADQKDPQFYGTMLNDIAHNERWSGELMSRRKNGEEYPQWMSISAIYDESGRITHYLSLFHDITESKRKENQIRHQALHDPLTGLPNRTLFSDRLTVAIGHAVRRNTGIAVFFIDLDNFKHITDELGHSLGDTILQEAAKRLCEVTRSEDTVSRLGGDEFVLMTEGTTEMRPYVEVAERILARFRESFNVLGHELFVTVSVGVAVFPENGEDAETLLRNADLAMYRAKARGKNCYSTYAHYLERLAGRITLESNLRKALERNEFTAFFQPRVSGDLSHTTGIEALVRWNRPGCGPVQPEEFIPVAEDNGLVTQIDLYVLRKACLLAGPLVKRSARDLRLSVNMSSKHFGKTELVPCIRDILDETGMLPEQLEVEITETAVMTDIDSAIDKLGSLAAMGIRITIDDFGTGYSSLYYLKKLPINVLKIDRSFIHDISIDQDNAELVASIIAMAKALKITVAAEGVETRDQVEFLQAHGCDELQGYYISRPVPITEIERLILSGRIP